MTYVHEEVEREAEGEEAVGEGADGGERAEVERQNEDVGARALVHAVHRHIGAHLLLGLTEPHSPQKTEGKVRNLPRKTPSGAETNGP